MCINNKGFPRLETSALTLNDAYRLQCSAFNCLFLGVKHASQIHARCYLCGFCDGGLLGTRQRGRDGALRDQLRLL